MIDALWRRSASELVALMTRGDVSSREVVDAHLDRITSIDPAVRAFAEVLGDEARATADARDRERREGWVRGPLHGLPISVKECFDLEGRATTLGVEALRSTRATRDAALVTVLREAGAVIIGRTNLSQMMIFAESRNPVYGQTANPWSLAHTPGGSSGGEAAAVASGMSPLGLGTDIGGSIRSPAHFSGIAGFKPTLDRLASRGQRSALPGQEAVRSVAGPMARTVADLWLLLRALDPVRMSALDGRVPPMAWSDPASVDVSALRIGWFSHDGLVAPSRAVARAVESSAKALTSLGCTVIPFTPSGIATVIGRYVACLGADGGETWRATLGRGPVDPVLSALQRVASMSDGARRTLASVAGVAGQGTSASLLRNLGEKSVSAYWKLVDQLRSDRNALIDELDAAAIDVLLCPAYATPALPHGLSKNFSLASTSAILWNVFQMPAGTVPVTRVRDDETTRARSFDIIERHAAKVDAASAGLPVGVQVVARPWHDHVALAVMSALETAVRSDEGYPRTPVDPR